MPLGLTISAFGGKADMFRVGHIFLPRRHGADDTPEGSPPPSSAWCSSRFNSKIVELIHAVALRAKMRSILVAQEHEAG